MVLYLQRDFVLVKSYEHRHWSPESESFASFDAFVTRLYANWGVGEVVKGRIVWLQGRRSIVVYEFELYRGLEKVVMPVICNPPVELLLMKPVFTIIWEQVAQTTMTMKSLERLPTVFAR